MRIFVHLFIAVMITTMGVLYLRIIEKPLEIYYKSEITHTAEHYSYKPGQSGTSFEFYIKRPDTGYDRLPFFQTLAIPTVFYLGILLFLNLFWSLVKSKKNKDRSDKSARNEEFKKFSKLILSKKSKSVNTISFVLVLVILAFFFSARAKKFGLGTTEKAMENIELEKHFNPTHLAYAGGDLIWLIEVNRKGNGGFMIEQESSNKMDSVFYNIQHFNLTDSTFTEVDSYFLGREDYQLDAVGANNQIWLIGRPKRLSVYNANSSELVYPDISAFAEKFEELSSGINQCYRQTIPKELLYVEALDGTRHYYDFESEKLEEKISLFTNDNEVFKLIKDKGAITNLGFTSNFKKYEKISETPFIDAEIIYQDIKQAIILHKSDISDEAKFSITCLNSKGIEDWILTEDQLPIIANKDELIKTKLQFKCSKFIDSHVITISSLIYLKEYLSEF